MRPLAFAVLLCAQPASAALDLPAALIAEAKAVRGSRKIFPLSLTPVAPAPGPALLDVPLSELRDRPLSAVRATIGGREWTIGVATDAGYDDFYLVLRSGTEFVMAPLQPVGRFLDNDGVVVGDADGPYVRLHARLSLLHPVNGISIVAVDAGGVPGRDSFTVGELVDGLKASGRSFRASNKEFHVFVEPEAADGGRRLTGERSIFITRFAGTRTRAWAVRESALQPGVPYRVTVADSPLVILKTVDGRLVIR